MPCMYPPPPRLVWLQTRPADISILIHIHSTLTGIPIAGQILTQCGGEFWGLIVFTIASYAASLVCLVAAKLYCCGWTGVKAIY